MKTRVEMLKEMGVSHADAEQYIRQLEQTLPRYGIADSRLRLAHFFAQVLHESGFMRFDMENLNYSADALPRVREVLQDEGRGERLCATAGKDRQQGLCQPHGEW